MNEVTKTSNPSVDAKAVALEERRRRRIPMSVPVRKMEVPPMEGFHLHWFLESNVARAIDGGYEHVNNHEVVLNQSNVGSDTSLSGNTDLGTRVSLVAGINDLGHPMRQYLMKIPEEWYNEDQKVLEKRNASIMEQIFKGSRIMGDEQVSRKDREQMYVKEEESLFQRPAPKAREQQR